MSQNTLSFIAILVILAVLIVLIRGLKSFFKGGLLKKKERVTS